MGFARAALELITHRDLWESMSHRAVEVMQLRFSSAVHTDRITAIYKNLIGY